ncbi:MAG: glucose-6-phosphate isomerase [Candidatus Omnitrophica bacterium]|nr:glucose-6-phosphate isomerase [Candidatus Omnitrophota bacterium]
MASISFDFNNMLSINIGNDHGVDEREVSAWVEAAEKAHQHLSAVLKDKKTRVNLGMEWALLPNQDKVTVGKIQALGKQIARKYENVISLGIGGSYLGIKAAQDALCPPYFNEFAALRKSKPRFYFEGNNLDPDTLNALLKNLNPKKTFVVVISKSGETTETKAAFMVVESWLKKAVGPRYGRQIIAITDPTSGSLRKKVTAAQEKDPLSFQSLPLLPGVGGRFSELNMGLLHLAIVGVPILEVLQGAQAMAKRLSEPNLMKNPAYLYAVLHTILYRKKDKSIAVLMPFSETLKSTADWYVQLLAESLGKKYARLIQSSAEGLEQWVSDMQVSVNLGRTPIASRGTNDLHSIQQNNIEGEHNKVITFIKVTKFKTDITINAKNDILSGKKFSELMQLAQEATEWALTRESRPSCTITLSEVNPFSWGGLLFFFEVATAFEGELLNLNTFDQPGVEGYKNYMYYALKKPGLPERIIQEIKNNPLKKNPQFILQ